MEFRRYLTLLWRWIWLIGLITLLGAGGGLGLSLATVPIYQAATTLLIDGSQSATGGTDYNAVLTGQRLAQTYARTVVAQPVLEKVIETLHLNVLVDKLGERVSVRVVRDTQLLVLTVEDAMPGQAAAIADEIVKQFLAQGQRQSAGRYTTAKQALQTELTNLQNDMERTQTRLAALPPVGTADVTAQGERGRLETLLAQDRSSYATLLKSLEDVRLAEIQSSTSLVVVEPARPDPAPARPRTLQNVLLGLVLGLLLALGVVILRDYFDDTVKAADDVERLFDLSTLGVISHISGKHNSGALVSQLNTHSPVSEAYRVLATNIEFAEVDRRIRTLLVTSSSPAEGKTTTVANLGLTLAQMGKRVILVDGDLRRPALHRMFGLPNGRGLTTALLDHSGVGEYLLPTGIENLRLLPSGPVPPNSARLISSQRMSELLAELQGQADLVICDSPPALVLADAALLARLCDSTLLVVRAGTTSLTALQKVHEHLAQTGTRLIGFVLNRASARSGGAYYQYYYSEDKHDTLRFWQRWSRPASQPRRITPAATAPAGHSVSDKRANG